MGHLSLLSEQDVDAMFATEKVRECYLKQRGNH